VERDTESRRDTTRLSTLKVHTYKSAMMYGQTPK
jgi:hypothetical protein